MQSFLDILPDEKRRKTATAQYKKEITVQRYAEKNKKNIRGKIEIMRRINGNYPWEL